MAALDPGIHLADEDVIVFFLEVQWRDGNVSRFIEPLGGPAPDEESPLRKFLRWLHPLDSIGSLCATLSGRGSKPNAGVARVFLGKLTNYRELQNGELKHFTRHLKDMLWVYICWNLTFVCDQKWFKDKSQNVYIYLYTVVISTIYKGATLLIWWVKSSFRWFVTGCLLSFPTYIFVPTCTAFSKLFSLKLTGCPARCRPKPGAYWLALFECSLATGISGFWQVIKTWMDFLVVCFLCRLEMGFLKFTSKRYCQSQNLSIS